MGRSLLIILPLLLIVSFTAGFPTEISTPGYSISLQKYVLEGLGMSKIPDMSKVNISQEEYSRMYKVYLKNVEDIRNLEMKAARLDLDLHSTVQRLLSFRHEGGKNSHIEKTFKTTKDSIWLHFPVTLNDDVEKATVKIFASVSGNKTVRVILHAYHVLDESRLLVGSQYVKLNTSGWIDLDVTGVVRSWNSSKSNNLDLEVRCSTCSSMGVTLLTEESNRGNVSSVPVLDVLVNERISTARKKRSDEDSFPDINRHTDCSKDNHRQRCCRHTMEVVFKDLPGFEFIIQPFRFDAGYCKGRCPPRYNPAHHHAVIQSLMWKKDKTRAPRPCCSPSKLADLEILHVDEKNSSALKVSTWKNMRVLECACS